MLSQIVRWLVDSSRSLTYRGVTVVLSAVGQATLPVGPDERRKGELHPCPDAPNCVSTLAKDEDKQHAIDPIRYYGSWQTAKSKLLAVINTMPRTTIVENAGTYLHVEFRSLVFRFVDDAEFLFDDRVKLIHFRSAARLGYSDLDVNRRRIERIRARFDAS